MKKKKIAVIIVMVIFGCVLLSSCGAKKGEEKQTERIDKETVTQEDAAKKNDSVEEVVPKKEYEMTVQSFQNISADDIIYYDTTFGYDFCVIEKNKKSGLIDYNGKIILPIEYGSISSESLEPYERGTRLQAISTKDEPYYVEKDGSLTLTEYRPWGYDGVLEVYWLNDHPILFHNDNGKKDFSREAYLSEPHIRLRLGSSNGSSNLCDIIPIRKITGIEDSAHSYPPILDSEKYGLFNMKTKKMVTDFIFDNFAFDYFKNGILPVKKGEKWGYVNEAGEMISDYIYDSSAIENRENRTTQPAVNGYIVVAKDNLQGLIDIKGKSVLDIKYQIVSQVNPNGMLWVKENGQWSLIKIEHKG